MTQRCLSISNVPGLRGLGGAQQAHHPKPGTEFIEKKREKEKKKDLLNQKIARSIFFLKIHFKAKQFLCGWLPVNWRVVTVIDLLIPITLGLDGDQAFLLPGSLRGNERVPL